MRIKYDKVYQCLIRAEVTDITPSIGAFKDLVGESGANHPSPSP